MKRWSIEEEETLIELIKNKNTHQEIAKQMERTVSSIQTKAHRLKISNNYCNSHTRKIKTTEKYKRDLEKVNKNILCIEDYKGCTIPIKHLCVECNTVSTVSPQAKLSGCGCFVCSHKNNSGLIPNNKPGIVYLVYLPNYNLYKIGITSKTTNERMIDNKIKNYEIILERYFEYGSEAIQLEKEWLSNIKEYKINTKLLSTGNTETFRY